MPNGLPKIKISLESVKAEKNCLSMFNIWNKSSFQFPNPHSAKGRSEQRRRDRKSCLNEEHLVFTGGGAGRDFCSSREGGHDWSQHHIRALGCVDGCVDASGAVVLHQGGRLPVVGVQTRAERRLVVVAAADERLARHLSAKEMDGLIF